MPLSAGDKLAHFEVVGAIGQGGMGEVYKARDTRLDRTVAIKVLHGLVASDPAFRERFEREARAVSSLNHPHICTLHDVGSEGGVDFLVMEHLEGETLAERLKKGRLPLEQALRYGIEIADALDNAHHHGVVHRDLKPGNVMLTSGGTKLFDFGLAKFDPSGPGAAEEDSALPTAAKPLTEKGTILGTFQYMAPEQLEGREADSRTDLFSFGAVLYEMVTGHKAFIGKSQASLITAIMGSEPSPMAKLTPMTPPQLEHIVGRCLAKDPESRWQTAKDVKMELEWIQEQPELSETAPPEVVTGGGRERLGWILGLLAAVVVTGLTVWNLTRSSDATLIRTAISLPLGFELDPRQDSRPLAISPDGSRIVYGALGGGAGSRLFLRPLDQFDATPLPGTENAINPFFSPDGLWVAFFADGKLLKVSVEGGAPIEITEAPFGSFGADWADDESIVFDNAFARGGLMRVSGDGGEPEVLTTVDVSGNDIAHRQPRSLSDGRGILLHIEDAADWRAAVRPADSGAVRVLRGIPTNATLVHYLPSGHLVYTYAGGLWAVAFDLETLESTGSPTIVLDGIYTNERNHLVAISEGGTLVYAVGESKVGGGFTLAWVDREGRVTPVAGEPGPYSAPVLSPDGSQLAVNLGDSAVAEAWIFDLVRGTRSRVGEQSANTPSWTPDGDRITYSTAKGIYSRRADGSGEPELVLPVSAGTQFGSSWSPDGKSLVYYQMHPSTGRDIWMLPLDGEPVPLVVTLASERSPKLSPNGRWLAYASNESGRDEIYVQAFPGLGSKQVISTDGGREPVWSRDGTELFYRSDGDDLLIVDVDTGDELKAGTPRNVLTARFAVGGGGRNQNYDVSPDGERFVFVQRDEGVPRELRVVLNWFEELERVVSQ